MSLCLQMLPFFQLLWESCYKWALLPSVFLWLRSHPFSSSQRLCFFNHQFSLSTYSFLLAIKYFVIFSILKKSFWAKIFPLANTSFLCFSLLQNFVPNYLYSQCPLSFLPYFQSSQALAPTSLHNCKDHQTTPCYYNQWPNLSPHLRYVMQLVNSFLSEIFSSNGF